MKFKTTQKAITNNYRARVKLSYCSAQFLLYFSTPIAYTSGTYGWNADIYDVNGVAFIIGYRPFGNISPDYDIVNEYEKRAEAIVYNHTLDYTEKKEQVSDLLLEFRNEVLRV